RFVCGKPHRRRQSRRRQHELQRQVADGFAQNFLFERAVIAVRARFGATGVLLKYSSRAKTSRLQNHLLPASRGAGIIFFASANWLEITAGRFGGVPKWLKGRVC